MADIVLGMAMPHSGMLGQKPEDWLKNGERDRKNAMLWYRNRRWEYPDLEAERIGEGLEKFLTLEERQTRSARCVAAIAKMRQVFEAAKVDVAIILGKDQKEIFVELSPSIAIYTGEEIYNGPPASATMAPDHAVTHKAYPALATHLVKSLQADGFDLTDLFRWPINHMGGGGRGAEGVPAGQNVPHAYAFIYHQVMADNPPPSIPIILNCFYAPTQPSMPRCIALGQALYRAIKAWPGNERVAVIASGGLSHFVCDETFDRRIMGYLGNFDFDGLAAVDDRSYQSGTSEIKLYATMLVSMNEIGAKMTLVDYIPCYRTVAGTGEGMGFMHWTMGK